MSSITGNNLLLFTIVLLCCTLEVKSPHNNARATYGPKITMQTKCYTSLKNLLKIVNEDSTRYLIETDYLLVTQPGGDSKNKNLRLIRRETRRFWDLVADSFNKCATMLRFSESKDFIAWGDIVFNLLLL